MKVEKKGWGLINWEGVKARVLETRKVSQLRTAAAQPAMNWMRVYRLGGSRARDERTDSPTHGTSAAGPW